LKDIEVYRPKNFIMVNGVVDSVFIKPPTKRVTTTPFIKRFATAVAVVVALLITGCALWPKSPLNLGDGEHMAAAGVFERWQAGDVVVLVRHAERCDRSSNPCLGPADGITGIGSDAAANVGKAFQAMGMKNTDVLNSPLTRTAQTARYMFGNESVSQEWLATCGQTLRDDVSAHKVAHRNLVLVTHSGCISDFESQMGFKHAPSSEYASSLFVSINAAGQPQVLGIVNAQDWQSVLDKRAAQ
jgi:phosphohistidine phosphatase SixA